MARLDKRAKDAPRPLALVTGASSGIGLEIALDLARRGYDLALAARSTERLEPVGETAKARGAAASLHAVDLGEPGAAAALWAQASGRAEADGRPLEVVVNNAGFGDVSPVVAASPDKLTSMVDLNCRALLELSRLAGADMAARGRGGILNVASIAGFLPGPNMATYYATKAFVLSFSEALHSELRPKGVHVTALCPGPVMTGFQAVANMEGLPMLERTPKMSAEAVAKKGLAALMRNKRGSSQAFPTKR